MIKSIRGLTFPVYLSLQGLCYYGFLTCVNFPHLNTSDHLWKFQVNASCFIGNEISKSKFKENLLR